MEVKIFGKKANRQALSGALALLIAAGSVTPAADTFGAGVSTKAYAEAGDTAGSEATDLEKAKIELETAITEAVDQAKNGSSLRTALTLTRSVRPPLKLKLQRKR